MDKMRGSKTEDAVDKQPPETGFHQRMGNSKGIIDKLYETYEELNAATDKNALELQYRNLLSAVQNGEKEKGLASQFITRFAEHFPTLAMETANALFDLCEDDDINLRKQAEKDLVTVCKKLPSLVPTVADVFCQILQTDNVGELNIVHNSLMSLFYINPEGAISGIFAQIKTGEPLIRDRCFKFLQSKYKNLGPEVMSPEFEKCLFEETNNIIKAVETREQFMITMDILNSTKTAKTEEGRKSIVKMIEVLLKKSFPISDSDDIAKLLFVADALFPFFHEENSSSFCFAYFCTRVLPKIQHLSKSNESDYFSVLKMTVDLSLYIGLMESNQVKSCLMNLMKVLDGFLFKAPKNSVDAGIIPMFNFSFIESILFLINKLGVMKPLLLDEVFKGQQEQLRPKIAFLLRVTASYKMRLQKELQSLSIPERKNEREKLLCLRALVNIVIVGRALYRFEAPFTEKIRLSWKITVASLSVCSSPAQARPSKRKVTLVKRSRCDEGDKDPKKPQENEAKLYHPPNGKYSGRTMSYDDDYYSSSSSKKQRVSRYDHSRSGRSASKMERYIVRRKGRY